MLNKRDKIYRQRTLFNLFFLFFSSFIICDKSYTNFCLKSAQKWIATFHKSYTESDSS